MRSFGSVAGGPVGTTTLPGRRGLTVVLLPSLLAAAFSFAALSALAATGEEHIRKELAVGESTRVGILGLEQATVLEVFCKGERLALLLEADGVVQFIGVGAQVDVSVTGTRGNRTEFGLGSTERVSIWPIRSLVIRRNERGFTLEARAADWAFVVSAHRTREGGLEVTCDDAPALISSGERLDVDSSRGKAAFRVIDEAWPGKLVQLPGAEPEEKVAAAAKRPARRVLRPVTAEPTLPPLPFVLTGWGAWEVRPPRVVSP